MSFPDDPIETLRKGYRPTLIEADKGNELINALNALRIMDIEPGEEDKVDLSVDGVRITYKGVDSEIEEREVILFDASDPSKGFKFLIKNGVLKTLEVVDSGIREKVITICEDGSSVDVTFLVREFPAPE